MNLRAYEPKKPMDGHMKQTILAQTDSDKKQIVVDSMQLRAYEPKKPMDGHMK